MVAENDPLALGVPLITPVEELRERPPGKDPPITVHVMGAVPLAESVVEYAVPTTPVGSGEMLVIEGGTAGIFIVRPNAWDVVPAELAAWNVTENDPLAAGTPLTTPVVEFSEI